jgi:hypothetical protein
VKSRVAKNIGDEGICVGGANKTQLKKKATANNSSSSSGSGSSSSSSSISSSSSSSNETTSSSSVEVAKSATKKFRSQRWSTVKDKIVLQFIQQSDNDANITAHDAYKALHHQLQGDFPLTTFSSHYNKMQTNNSVWSKNHMNIAAAYLLDECNSDISCETAYADLHDDLPGVSWLVFCMHFRALAARYAVHMMENRSAAKKQARKRWLQQYDDVLLELCGNEASENVSMTELQQIHNINKHRLGDVQYATFKKHWYRVTGQTSSHACNKKRSNKSSSKKNNTVDEFMALFDIAKKEGPSVACEVCEGLWFPANVSTITIANCTDTSKGVLQGTYQSRTLLQVLQHMQAPHQQGVGAALLQAQWPAVAALARCGEKFDLARRKVSRT